jgi:hypothetical protein
LLLVTVISRLKADRVYSTSYAKQIEEDINQQKQHIVYDSFSGSLQDPQKSGVSVGVSVWSFRFWSFCRMISISSSCTIAFGSYSRLLPKILRSRFVSPRICFAKTRPYCKCSIAKNPYSSNPKGDELSGTRRPKGSGVFWEVLCEIKWKTLKQIIECCSYMDIIFQWPSTK